MVGSTAWMTERIELMEPGATMEVAGYQMTFRGVEQIRGPNYIADQGTIEVTRDGDPVAVLTPEKRWYPVAQMQTTEAAIHTTFVSDIYAALGEPKDGGAWSIRAYHHPLVPWIWFGCVVMVIGGMASLSDRRLRIGAPARRQDASCRGPAAGGVKDRRCRWRESARGSSDAMACAPRTRGPKDRDAQGVGCTIGPPHGPAGADCPRGPRRGRC